MSQTTTSGLSRRMGIAAAVSLIFSWAIPPFVGTSSLLTAVQPSVLGIIGMKTFGFSDATLILADTGFALLVIGSGLSLIFFGIRFKPASARTGMLVSIAGLLLITMSLFDYSGDFILKIVTPTRVGIWPTLDFFGIGYFISWIAIIVGLVSTRERRQRATAELIQMPRPPQAKHVPPELLATGYSALDNILLGGLPVGSSIVLTGPSWDEKKLIVRRCLETNLANNRGCLCICSNMFGVQDLIQNYRKLLQVILCHPQADTIAAEFADVVKLKTLDNLTEINLEYSKALARLPAGKPVIFCLEILDDVLLEHHSATRRWLMDILGRSKSYQITTLATLNPDMHPTQESQAVLEVFDGHIELFEGEIQVRPKLMRVSKLAGHAFLDEELVVRRDKI